jgi:hypothetical protein
MGPVVAAAAVIATGGIAVGCSGGGGDNIERDRSDEPRLLTNSNFRTCNEINKQI